MLGKKPEDSLQLELTNFDDDTDKFAEVFNHDYETFILSRQQYQKAVELIKQEEKTKLVALILEEPENEQVI